MTGAHDSKAIVPTGSTWTLKVPAAGTELMVAGLKERMGRELAQINFQINHPGLDDGDTKPRCYHHIEPTMVQWCKDKALVWFVALCLWRTGPRERYLNAFGLSPQRCCVLRHAVDLHPNSKNLGHGSSLALRLHQYHFSRPRRFTRRLGAPSPIKC